MGCSSSTDNFDESPFLEIHPHQAFAEKECKIRGEKRNIVSWIPTQKPIKAIVLISHGLHEHALKYFEIAQHLTGKGYAVYAIDHYAHGKSAGERGLITDFSILPADFIEFAKLVQSENEANLPTFLLAHSMGTLVGIIAAMSIANLKAIIFSGTPIVVGPGAGSAMGIRALYPISQWNSAERIASFMASVSPSGPGFPIKVVDLTNDPDRQQMIVRDPRTYHKDIRNKTGFEVLKMTNVAKMALSSLNIPMLCIHGSDDEVSLLAGSEFLLKTAATADDRKSLRVFEKCKHEIFYEIKEIRRESFTCVCNYFDTELVKRPDDGFSAGADVDANATNINDVPVKLDDNRE